MNERNDAHQTPDPDTSSPNTAFVTGLIVGGIGLLIPLTAFGVLSFHGRMVPRPVMDIIGVTNSTVGRLMGVTCHD